MADHEESIPVLMAACPRETGRIQRGFLGGVGVEDVPAAPSGSFSPVAFRNPRISRPTVEPDSEQASLSGERVEAMRKENRCASLGSLTVPDF